LKIATIIGARPQFVKAAVVSNLLKAQSNVDEIIIHTGQHFDKKMSDVFFKQMNIPQPDYFLNINCLSHGAMTGRMIEEIEKILIKICPDFVLLYGDTNSTLAGAIAANKLQVKIAHVEAGLRSFNHEMPEETNRILTDRISDILFCPTVNAVNNLKKEGFDNFNSRIVFCGDVMYDAVKLFSDKIDKDTFVLPDHFENDPFILATFHRQENTNNLIKLASIVDALNLISKQTNVLVPLHPRTQNILNQHNIKTDFDIIEPVGYLQMLYLLKHTEMVLTDSGGLQKETYFLNKPCIVLREQTEWVELVEHGYAFLTGSDKDKIYQVYKKLISQNDFIIQINDLYGDGNAGKIIVNELLNF